MNQRQFFSPGGLHRQQRHLLQIRRLWLPDPEGVQGRRGERQLRRAQELGYLWAGLSALRLV